MRSAILIFTLVVVLPAAVYAADDGDAKRGLRPGEMIPGPFHPYNVTGASADRQHCLVCQQGLNPTVMIFAREAPNEGEPLADFLAGLDKVVGKRRSRDTLGAFAVFLSEGSRDTLKTKLKALASSKEKEIKFVTLAIDREGSDSGLKKYAIDKNADVVIVLYDELRVVANYTFPKGKLTADDAKAILSEVEKKLGRP